MQVNVRRARPGRRRRPLRIVPVLLLIAAASTACEKKTPEPPNVTPGPPETVTGVERLGWTQTAADRAEAAAFRFAVYVDGVRSELAGAACEAPALPSSSSFECTAPLPALSPGSHTIELATFVIGTELLESERSGALQVNLVAAVTAAPGRNAPEPWTSGVNFLTADGFRLRVDRLADGLVLPADIAFVPDGRVLVAEEPGRVRVIMPDGRLLPEAALSLADDGPGNTRLLAVAVDADFDTTHFVYATYTRRAANGAATFTLARFREAGNLLVQEVVLLDGIPASFAGAASLRVGADGKLFAAFDDGGDPARSGDLASFNGKVLRLNPDGTTPDDQAGLMPTYASDFHRPRGLDWQPASALLWITDRSAGGGGSLIGVGAPPGVRQRAVRLASYTLPRGTIPASAAFYRGDAMPGLQNDLLIASDEGRHLLRVRFDRAAGTRVVATERLLQDVLGPVRVVAVSPGGALYLATPDAVARVAMAP
jgi:glucose/arabinose dehydrogenase